MKKILFILIFIITFYPCISAASIADYCAVPPFITQSVCPNVLIILDNSGSMYDFAYKNDFNPSVTYYGYFDSNKKYKYNNSGGYFYEDESGEWDGNFLNWLTMRRVDILKKVLVGGREIETGGVWYLIGAPNPDRDYNKEYSNVDDYTPYSGNQSFLVTGGKFYVGYWWKKVFYYYDNPYYIKIKLEGEKTGIVQKMWNKVRFGLMFFNVGNRYEDGVNLDGGYVAEQVSGPGENQELVSKIRNIEPSTWTPLAETYYEAIRYFEAESSAYNRGVSYSNNDPIQYRCQKSFVLLITDGESTKDKNLPGSYFYGRVGKVTDSNLNIKTWMDKIAENENYSSQWSSDFSGDGTYYLEGVAYYSHVSDLRNDMDGTQNLSLYVVYTFGNSDTARDLLKKAAKYGGFNDINNNNIPDLQKEWDSDSNDIPDNYYEAQEGKELENKIMDAINNMLKQVSSGTATSVLSEKERVNAGILQAAFYPQKILINNGKSYTVDWAGSLYNWWFYTSETGQTFKSNMREDTIVNKDLDICSNGSAGGDYIMSYEFEDNKLKIKAFKSSCTGDNVSSTADVVYDGLDEAHSVWEAGSVLAQENAMDRKIYTYVDDTQPSSPKDLVELKDLSNDSNNNLYYSKLFGDENGDGTIDEETESVKYSKSITFSDLKNYIYGVDISGYRERKINPSGDVWKLGDIIYSTPKIVNYDDYAVAFVGANDGMLHAFRVGKYRYDRLGVYQLAKLRNDRTYEDTDKLGEELWAFIPKNALPYLRFLADPDYCHLYYVDLTPTIIELDNNSDGTIDKRILIGGMRLGGAVGCDNSSVCINPPEDTCDNTSAYAHDRDPVVSSSNYCLGLSSYFALDITDPVHPKFLWEFTNKNLGFSYSGPTFIKRRNDSGGYNYYVMFASGPTNYNGEVGQKLRLFVLRLKDDFTISSTYTINVSDELGLGNAFGGRMSKYGVLDDSRWYETTKAVFFGVVYKDGDNWKGNVVGVKIDDDNPANWTIFKLFSNPIGPVIVPISYYKCNVGGSKKGFLYFGSGRYFFRDDDPGKDDSDIERLYGIKIEACLESDGDTDCTLGSSALHTSENSCSYVDDTLYGWYQDLDPKGDGYNKERDITGTTVSSMDAVFFTTTEPTSDICGFGGRSRMWGMNCATGESLVHQTCNLTGRIVGTLLLQTSVGKITKFDMDINPQNPTGGSNPFTKKNDKATDWTVGTAPPNRSAIVERPTRNPAEILYEIER